jgi:hypothetical protein
MSAGSLVGGIVTLFGAIAGAALIAAGLDGEWQFSLLEAWIVFVVCFGTGILTLLSFARRDHAPLALRAPGALALVLGLAAGGVALAKTLGLLGAGPTASLWAICALCLPAGILLMNGAAALRRQSPGAAR